MKKLQNIGLVALLCGAFVACDDDSSTSANDVATSSDSSALLSSGDALSAEGVAAGSSSSAKAIVNSSDDGAPASSVSDGASSSAVVTSSAVESSVSALPANYDPETGLLTDERDGNIYKTAKVGSQIWMAQNLRMDNPPLIDQCDRLYIDSTITADSTLQKFGHHYGWITATQIPCDYEYRLAFSGDDHFFTLPHQGICPTGWHIPTLDEWQELFDVAALSQLLSTEWNTQYFVGTDDYGFALNIANREVGESSPEFMSIDEASETDHYTISFVAGDESNPLHVVQRTKFSKYAYLRCLMD